MKQKGKWRHFWDQLIGEKELIGTFIIGSLILLGDFISYVSSAENISVWSIVLRSIGLLALILGTVFYVYRSYRTAQWILAEKHIPVVFVVGQPRDKAEGTLIQAQETITLNTGFKEFHRFEKSLNISYRDLLIHERSRLKPNSFEWHDFIKDGLNQVSRFVNRLPGDKIYHIFILGPASLAMGLGVAFGSKHKMIVYHHQDGKYQPVLDFTKDLRRIKTSLQTEPHHIKVNYPDKLTEDTAIVAKMASHVPKSDVVSYLKSINKDVAVIDIENTYGGNFQESNWTGPVQELYSILIQTKSAKGVKHIHLFHAMPIPMAFGLGFALGNFVSVTVYNWESSEETYYPILQLNKLESTL